MILILTNTNDISADFVVHALRNRGKEFVRFNTDTLPNENCTIRLPDFSYFIPHKNNPPKNLAGTLKSVWLRRPLSPFDTTRNSNNQYWRYIRNQWRAFIDGLSAIPNVFWMNNPHQNRISENKIRQLQVAKQIGLKIPETCITSSKDEALSFYEMHLGNIVVKALDAPLLEFPEQSYFIFTNESGPLEDIPKAEFSLAPTIFQERLSPKIDYRITVVGNNIYSVRIEMPTNETIDWRLNKSGTKFTSSKIPADISEKSIALVKNLGLEFGAIDVVEAKDDFYFLEINPNGEWGWLQRTANVPIAESIADCLISGENRGH